MTVTINLTGARGGQGTSTTAAALALLAARRGHVVELVARDVPAMRALLGMATDEKFDRDVAVEVASGLTLRREPSGDATLVIGDNPRSGDAETQSGGSCRRTLVVLRGPCYLSLRAAIDASDAVDGVVVVREQGRSVTNRDITEITDLPVVAETSVTPHVARSIDAGVLPATIHRRPEFSALDAYLETLTPDLETPHPTARSVCHIDHSKRVRFDRSTECTDLPLPQAEVARGRRRSAARTTPRPRPRRIEVPRPAHEGSSPAPGIGRRRSEREPRWPFAPFRAHSRLAEAGG